jgi:hypothetical protein
MGTVFVEFKEEVLPKIIPAVVDSLWYPKAEEEPAEEDGTNEEPAEEEVVDGE